MPNRRREPRAEVEFEVHYRTAQEFLAAYSRNISRGGIYIQTQHPLQLAQEALIRFTLPGMPHRFEVNGVVVWINFPTAHHSFPAGMGMKFLDLDPKARRLISGFIKKAQTPAPPSGKKR